MDGNNGRIFGVRTSHAVLIYHNIRWPHRPGQVRRERGGSQPKPTTTHPVNHPDRDR